MLDIGTRQTKFKFIIEHRGETFTKGDYIEIHGKVYGICGGMLHRTTGFIENADERKIEIIELGNKNKIPFSIKNGDIKFIRKII